MENRATPSTENTTEPLHPAVRLLSTTLVIDTLTEQDWPVFLRLHTEPAVIEKCFDPKPQTELRARFATRLQGWQPDSNDWLTVAVRERSSGNIVGVTGFCFDGQTAEVGYLFLPEYYGRGFATESLSAIIDWAVQCHGITRFQAVVTEGNVASERVLEKCGFRCVEIVPDAYSIDGKRYADHIFNLNRQSGAA